MLTAIAVVALVGTGLMAGLFFMASVAIMPGLGRQPPAGAMASMQSINQAIQNPLFLAVFGGTALVCLVVAAAAPFADGGGPVWYLAGGLLYVIGGLVVTAAANVPMNNALAAADPDTEEGAGVWADYLVRWTRWNHIRAVACTAATSALAVGLTL